MVKIASTSQSLKKNFLAYIRALNTHIPDTGLDLSRYMESKLIVNKIPYTLADYEASLLALMNAAPDFHINVQLLVVEGATVATRFMITCTPVTQFMGYEPNGNSVQYAEHVFYRFQGGKCCEVTALVDKETLKSQLGVGSSI